MADLRITKMGSLIAILAHLAKKAKLEVRTLPMGHAEGSGIIASSYRGSGTAVFSLIADSSVGTQSQFHHAICRKTMLDGVPRRTEWGERLGIV